MDAEEIFRRYRSGQLNAEAATLAIRTCTGDRASLISAAKCQGWWDGDAADACEEIRKAPGRRGRARHQARRYGWWVEKDEDKEAPKHPVPWLMPMVTYSQEWSEAEHDRLTSEVTQSIEAVRSSDDYLAARAILDVTAGIQRQMEAQGVTRTELARRLGTSTPAITRFLRGCNNFTLRTVVSVLNALDCRLETRVVSLTGPSSPGRDLPPNNDDEKKGADD